MQRRGLGLCYGDIAKVAAGLQGQCWSCFRLVHLGFRYRLLRFRVPAQPRVENLAGYRVSQNLSAFLATATPGNGSSSNSLTV